MSVEVKAQTMIGRRSAYTSEVVELEPDRRLDIPSGLSRVAAPIMELAMSRATTRDLARLKALLEAGERAN